ncbi:hypothetical protein C0993_008185 [Termitomyces sp. T159_Od127]|nr:hypothetical protein C0993_008185 [Termitomyces sp. T159_Od127]
MEEWKLKRIWDHRVEFMEILIQGLTILDMKTSILPGLCNVENTFDRDADVIIPWPNEDNGSNNEGEEDSEESDKSYEDSNREDSNMDSDGEGSDKGRDGYATQYNEIGVDAYNWAMSSWEEDHNIRDDGSKVDEDSEGMQNGNDSDQE